jgi:phosphatidylinositol 4-phosphatase
VCAQEVERVGSLEDHEIYLIKKCAVFAIPRSINLSENDRKIEDKYFKMLTDFLDSSGFYFSPTRDISHTCQRLAGLSATSNSRPFDSFDKRFFWNRYIAEEFLTRGLGEWVVPVMDGFIRVEHIIMNGSRFCLYLISRRGCLRSGARFHTRGADPFGNVANFVETEQIISYNGMMSSFVEIRGSIPLLWTQRGKDLKDIKPAPLVQNSLLQTTAFLNHIKEIEKLYGTIVLASLIDHKGSEQAIGEAFELRLIFMKSVKATDMKI